MVGPSAAVAAVRVAVRRSVAQLQAGKRPVIVACSGGTDSLALAAGVAHELRRTPQLAHVLVVDHGLQTGSSQISQTAAQQCQSLGFETVQVVKVDVQQSGAGLEADARTARLAAMHRYAHEIGARAVLVGHTQSDQAESVLLGLARGSGANSLMGMATARPLPMSRSGDSDRQPPTEGTDSILLVRPLLDLPRETTVQVCLDLGLTPWQDPHNVDPRFARVRARNLLPTLEAELGPGVGPALARTAALLRRDSEALEQIADVAYQELGQQPWPVSALQHLHPAVRARCWRRLAHDSGSPTGSLTSTHLDEIDRLLVDWHGQGPIDIPGGLRARRKDGFLRLESTSPSLNGPCSMANEAPTTCHARATE